MTGKGKWLGRAAAIGGDEVGSLGFQWFVLGFFVGISDFGLKQLLL